MVLVKWVTSDLYSFNAAILMAIFSWIVGDQVDAVVPFMGESISDGTLAKFLKSKLFN